MVETKNKDSFKMGQSEFKRIIERKNNSGQVISSIEFNISPYSSGEGKTGLVCMITTRKMGSPFAPGVSRFITFNPENEEIINVLTEMVNWINSRG